MEGDLLKLPRKTFEFVDSSLITSSPTKLRIEWYLSFTTICILLASFVFWNSPGWLYYADIAYLLLVLSIFLAGVALSFSWLIFAADRFFIKKLSFRMNMRNLPLICEISRQARNDNNVALRQAQGISPLFKRGRRGGVSILT